MLIDFKISGIINGDYNDDDDAVCCVSILYKSDASPEFGGNGFPHLPAQNVKD